MQAVRRIRKLVQKAHGAHVPRALWIAAAVIALPLQASGALSDEPPPLPRPRPAEAPPRTAPHEAAPAEHAQPEPAIDQACLDRLGAAGIEFESITLPPASKSGCAIDTPVRLKAVKPDGDEHMQATVAAIRVAACGWFTTVLGPGSDAAHADHMHVDIMQHGSSDRYRICQ